MTLATVTGCFVDVPLLLTVGGQSEVSRENAVNSLPLFAMELTKSVPKISVKKGQKVSKITVYVVLCSLAGTLHPSEFVRRFVTGLRINIYLVLYQAVLCLQQKINCGKNQHETLSVRFCA